jgi:hypothetical protein
LRKEFYHKPQTSARINDFLLHPHPTVDPTRIGTFTLRELAALLNAGAIAPDRQRLAGVPPLPVIRAELERRALLAGREVAR